MRITETIKDKYLHGDCPILAVELHKLSGLPLQVMYDYSDFIDKKVLVHAFVRLNDTQVLDINGIKKISKIEDDFDIETGAWIENTSIEDLLNIGYHRVPDNKEAKEIAKIIWNEYLANSSKYYHGSPNELKIGDKIKFRENYEEDWKDTSFYFALEHYRPKSKLAHKESVFMVNSLDNIDLAGGSTDFVYRVKPIGNIEKHDLNWGSEISCLIEDGYDINSEEIRTAALNYWTGIPHENESVWEFTAKEFEIISIIDENDNEIINEANVYIEAEKLHHTHDDFIDGDLAERIERFSHYVIGELELSQVQANNYYLDEDLIEDYKEAFKKSEFPPIIYDATENDIIDGNHRVNAAIQLGLKSIPAYIGTKEYLIKLSIDDNLKI